MDATGLEHGGGLDAADGTERAAAKAKSEVWRRNLGREEGGFEVLRGSDMVGTVGELELPMPLKVVEASCGDDVTVFVISSSGRRMMMADGK